MPAILFYLLHKNKKTTKRKIIKKKLKSWRHTELKREQTYETKQKLPVKEWEIILSLGVGGLNSLNKVEDNCIYIILFVENLPKKWGKKANSRKTKSWSIIPVPEFTQTIFFSINCKSFRVRWMNNSSTISNLSIFPWTTTWEIWISNLCRTQNDMGQ